MLPVGRLPFKHHHYSAPPKLRQSLSILHHDVNALITLVTQILDSMLERREPASFSRLGINIPNRAILVGESQMTTRNVHNHSPRMRMQFRFLMWTIVDMHHLNVWIFEIDLVVRGLNL